MVRSHPGSQMAEKRKINENLDPTWLEFANLSAQGKLPDMSYQKYLEKLELDEFDQLVKSHNTQLLEEAAQIITILRNNRG